MKLDSLSFNANRGKQATGATKKVYKKITHVHAFDSKQFSSETTYEHAFEPAPVPDSTGQIIKNGLKSLLGIAK